MRSNPYPIDCVSFFNPKHSPFVGNTDRIVISDFFEMKGRMRRIFLPQKRCLFDRSLYLLRKFYKQIFKCSGSLRIQTANPPSLVFPFSISELASTTIQCNFPFSDKSTFICSSQASSNRIVMEITFLPIPRFVKSVFQTLFANSDDKTIPKALIFEFQLQQTQTTRKLT